MYATDVAHTCKHRFLSSMVAFRVQAEKEFQEQAKRLKRQREDEDLETSQLAVSDAEQQAKQIKRRREDEDAEVPTPKPVCVVFAPSSLRSLCVCVCVWRERERESSMRSNLGSPAPVVNGVPHCHHISLESISVYPDNRTLRPKL
jgi:hypothetical protein